MSCKSKTETSRGRKLSLQIGGKKIPLVPFVHNALRDMIIAFTNNLKDHDGGKIEIEIE